MSKYGKSQTGAKIDAPAVKISDNNAQWVQLGEMIADGYECELDHDFDSCVASWLEAWDVFEDLIKKYPKQSILSTMESDADAWGLDGWLQDFEMELGNAKEYEKRIKICENILDTFDWEDDPNYSCFKNGIGDSLFGLGKIDEAKAYYTEWLDAEPSNANAASVYSGNLEDIGEHDAAYEVLKRAVYDLPCDRENAFIYERIEEMADSIGKTEDAEYYRGQVKKCRGEVPIVKAKKIYPNAPCPCGSGKKYKKCCGKV